MDTFPNDNNRKPTCVEDCQPNTRRKWMLAHDAEYLRNAIKELATSFIELTEYCYEQGAVKEEWKNEFIAMANNWVERSKWNWAKHELMNQVELVCNKLTLLADSVGVERESVPDEEDVFTLDKEDFDTSRQQDNPSLKKDCPSV